MSDTLDGTVFLVSPNDRSAGELRALADGFGEGVDVQAFDSIESFLKHGDPDRAACLVLDLRHADAAAAGPPEPQRAQRVTLPVLCVTGSRRDAPRADTRAAGGGPPAELSDLVRQVLEAAAASKRAQAARGEIARRLLALTPRERQVMERVVQGASNKMIAYEFGVSPRTVEIHRAHLMEKTGAQSLSELVRMAFAVGAVGTPEDAADPEVED